MTGSTLPTDDHTPGPRGATPSFVTDHVVPAADGSETFVDNGQGLCEVCN